MENLTFICDTARHLVCLPYNLENLRKMAEILQIKDCWLHRTKGLYHYDIPAKRIAEITARCTVVKSAQIVGVIRGTVTTV